MNATTCQMITTSGERVGVAADIKTDKNGHADSAGGGRRKETFSVSAQSTLIRVLMIVLLIALTGCLPSNHTRPPMNVAELVKPELLDNRIVINDFDPDEEKIIRVQLKRLLSQRCSNAYTLAGLRSPLQIIIEDGVIFYPSKDLHFYSASALGLTHQQIRKSYRESFSSGRAQAGTVPPVLYGVRLTVDNRPRIFLHDTAFIGESFLFNRLSPHDVLVHEFIHAGGQPPTPGWFFQHDLAGFKHYDKIMEACQ